MIRRLAGAAALLLATIAFSPAFAQSPNQPPASRYGPYDRASAGDRETTVDADWYGSLGFAWSGELGFELELGGKVNVGDMLEFRLAPVNLSLFDGDYITEDRYFPDDDNDCDEDDFEDGYYFEAFCDTEIDTEWRSVAEARLHLTPRISLGAGVSYLLQGDFKPEDGRVSTFLSLSTQVDETSALELRAGSEYIALRIAGKW
jgi:hypothetical protein